MKREYLMTFFFNSLDLQKIKNHVATFPYWFWFGKKEFKCLNRFIEHVII
jgi:hypothetical protein